MPVKKTRKPQFKEIEEIEMPACCTDGDCAACYQPVVGRNTRKILYTLLGILLVYIIVFIATLIRNNIAQYDHIGEADRPERQITVTADAKVTVSPDVAATSIGMISQGKTVAEAQQKNTEVMNALIEKLGALGIDKKDIQTGNYTVYPYYTYPENQDKVLQGYEVTQNVEIKIRDLQKANQVFAIAGEVGANNVGGLQFTVDNSDAYLAQAREEALAKIAEKKRSLEKNLNVEFGDVVSYYEQPGGDVYPSYKSYAEGMGGGAVPSVEPGSSEVVLNVHVTYEVR